ncbi:hypothetical protein ACH6CV_10105 [Bacillota bacterium Meth-B3]|jgi:hypothetical protein
MPDRNPTKVYVQVSADFGADGRMLPRSLVWEDGTRYNIDQVLACKPAAAMRAGGQGERFTIRVDGHEKYLFFERSTELSGPNIGKWFVERKVG